MESLKSTHFIVEPGTEGDVAGALAERFQALELAISPSVRTYYDTFDWRLYRAGGTLSAVRGRSGWSIAWRRLDGEPLHRLELADSDELPGFAWDWPEGPLRSALEPVVEMRRLLPLLTLEHRGSQWRILDDEGKTVVRAVLEDLSVGGGTEPVVLAPRLEVRPVRGYAKAEDRLRRFVERRLGLVPTSRDLFAEALQAMGREPGDYTSKVQIRLDPDMPSCEAARVIHLTLLDTLEANEDGTRRDLDSEFLHDFRVAVRRTRSALGQLKGVLPPQGVERFKRELSWLGKLTGTTRDLDVYLLKMPAYRASLPSAVADQLEPLQEFLVRHQRQEQRALASALEGDRYRRLKRDWRAFLQGPARAPRPEEAPNAQRPIAELASERIWRIYRRILKRGSRIDHDTPAERLHEVRIEGKKLRYLMEFFRSLYPGKEIGRAIKALKRLQDNLGDFNDYEVQQASLGRFAEQMVQEGEVPAATLLAMGRLLARLEEGQDHERRAFHGHFEEFASDANLRRYRQLFRPH